MQEVFAGFLEHADAQIGRVVDAIEQMGLAATACSAQRRRTRSRGGFDVLAIGGLELTHDVSVVLAGRTSRVGDR
jgi:hypothetical protein